MYTVTLSVDCKDFQVDVDLLDPSVLSENYHLFKDTIIPDHTTARIYSYKSGRRLEKFQKTLSKYDWNSIMMQIKESY